MTTTANATQLSLHEEVLRQEKEIKRLRAVLLSTRQYLEGIENYPEPGDTIKEIDAALGPR